MRLRRLLPVIVLLGGLAGLLAWLALTPAPALEAGPLVVEIPAHEGILGIADRLGRAGVIRSRAAFVAGGAVRGNMRRLKAGEYDIPRGATTVDNLELLTLASIIEREAVDPAEQKLIWAVFWNRLRRDMPLQADPTVQYAVAKERRALTRADLASDHPYNTYVHRGLPPGPIASPGVGAIEAALDPAPVKYLYFVARDDRRHSFSTTVAEHNAAVARYRLSRRQL